MLQTIVLALVQSATEFLPISSSAHLIIVPYLSSWADQGMAFDVAMHIGTLLAVIIYFRKDVAAIVEGGFGVLRRQTGSKVNLFLCLVIATIPALAFGFLLEAVLHADFRSIKLLACTLIFFGIVLYVVDKLRPRTRTMAELTIKDAFYIGVAQAIALIPGTSRSGITMTMARYLGFNREDAARFSMLLSIPTISAAGLWTALKIFQAGDSSFFDMQVFIGMLVSALGGLAAIWFLLAWLKKASFGIFALYRIILGVVLLVIAF